MQKSKGVERLTTNSLKLRRAGNDHSIERAVDLLDDNLEDIPDVKTWAQRMGYSRSHFSTKIKEHFGKTPSKILRQVRMKYLHKKIPAHPLKTSSAIADMVGLKDEDALYHFLSNHSDTNFTALKKELLNGGSNEPGVL